jgi:hypothetical protein
MGFKFATDAAATKTLTAEDAKVSHSTQRKFLSERELKLEFDGPSGRNRRGPQNLCEPS